MWPEQWGEVEGLECVHLKRRYPDPEGVTPRSPGLPAQRETLGL